MAANQDTIIDILRTWQNTETGLPLNTQEDTGNSTSTALNNGEVFYGPWTRRTAPEMLMSPYSDQNFTFYAQFANTELSTVPGTPVYTAGSAAGIDSSISYAYTTGIYVPRRLIIAREWYRIVIVNDSGSNMTDLRFQTSIGTFDSLQSKLNSTLALDADCNVTRSIITGQDPDNNYMNVSVNRDQHLNVNLPSEQFGNKLISSDREVFGTVPTLTRIAQVRADFSQSLANNRVTTSTTGSGSVTQGSGKVTVSSGTDATASARLDSTDTVRYAPGREIYSIFTAAFTTPTDSASFQRTGLFDDNNGFFIGYEGTSFGITLRSGGSDTTTAQASFADDTLTGDPTSDFIRSKVPEALDPTLYNIYRIRFGWLGAAAVFFEIMSPEGTWVTFHTIQYPNTATVPHILSPNLSLRSEVGKTSSDSTDLQILTSSWDAGIVDNASSYELSVVNGNNYVTANVSNQVISSTVYTVSTGRYLHMTSLIVSVENTSTLLTGTLNIRDGNGGTIILPITIPVATNQSNGSANIQITFPVSVVFSTAVYAQLAIGTVTYSIMFVGYEASYP